VVGCGNADEEVGGAAIDPVADPVADAVADAVGDAVGDPPANDEATDDGAEVGPHTGRDASRAGAGAGAEAGAGILDETEEAEPRSFTIAASGDLLIHDAVRQQAADNASDTSAEFDFRRMFDEVRPVLSDVDLAICHLEVPLSADNSTLSGYPVFSAPWQLAPAIADAGFDACSTASNHSMDQGGDGATQTLDALDEAGVRHAGMSRTEQEATTPRIATIGDVEVAHLSYTYGLNGMPLPPDVPWMVDLIDEERILADAARAREAGAEFVVASMHWGVEYQQTPSTEQRQLAEAMLADDAVDLILGHHAHVVQPIEVIDGYYAIYGLGNFLSNQSASCCRIGTQDGVIVTIEVEETLAEETRTGRVDGGLRVAELSYVPTRVDRRDFTIIDVGRALEDPELPEDRRGTLTASWDRTVEAITAEGADAFGVEPREADGAHRTSSGP